VKGEGVKGEGRIGPRAKLLALVSLFALPIVASFTAYHFYTPDKTSNYGELLTPAPVTTQVLGRAGGGPFRFEELRGKWVLVASDSGACAEACREKLATMRQVRLALGRNASRVERVFVVDDLRPPDTAALQPFAGTLVAITPAGMTLPPVPANDRAHIYVIDPRGDVMMRFPAATDRKKMLHDLNRLLRASQIG
jgi:cytochrome oxidase Cu insertion factor (SCO1/SenC/PrrC family)